MALSRIRVPRVGVLGLGFHFGGALIHLFLIVGLVLLGY